MCQMKLATFLNEIKRRFVGYLEEQAVITYTHILEEMDGGNLPMWRVLPAPDIAKTYWQLPGESSQRVSPHFLKNFFPK